MVFLIHLEITVKTMTIFLTSTVFVLFCGCLMNIRAESSVLDFLPGILSAAHSTPADNVKPPVHPRPNGPPYVYSSTLSQSDGSPGDWLSVRGERLAYQYNDPQVRIGSLGISLEHTLVPNLLTFRLPNAAELQAAGVYVYGGSLPVTVNIDYGVDDSGTNRWFTIPATIINIPKPIPVPIGLSNFITPARMDEQWVPVEPGGAMRLECDEIIASDATNLNDLQVKIGNVVVPVINQGRLNPWTDAEGVHHSYVGYVDFKVPDSIAAGKYHVSLRRKSNPAGWGTQTATLEVVRNYDPVFQGLWPAGTAKALLFESAGGKMYPNVLFRADIPARRKSIFITVTGSTLRRSVFELAPGVFLTENYFYQSFSVPPSSTQFQLNYEDVFGTIHSTTINVDLHYLSGDRYVEYINFQPADVLYVPTGNYLRFSSGSYSGPGTDYAVWIEGLIPQENAIKIIGRVYLHPPQGRYTVHVVPLDEGGIAREFQLVVAPIVPHATIWENVQAATGGEISLGGMKVVIPPHALSGDAQIRMEQMVPSLLGNGDPITDDHHGFGIHFTPDVSTTAPIQIELPYEVPTGGSESDLVAAFLDESTGLLDTLPTVIENGLAKITIPVVQYAQDTWPNLRHFPPTYEDAVRAANKVLPPINSLLNSLTVVHTKYGVFPEPTDDVRKIKVMSPQDPSASGYVPPAVAAQILHAAQQAYDLYVNDVHFPKPDGWINIFTQDFGEVAPSHGVSGKTTAGVFGQPCVYINSRMRGDFLKTSTAHEFGHAMQRQMNTNLRGLWLDEGVANWGAYKVFGATDDLVETINNGSAFPTKPFPTSWWLHWDGLDQEQDYATMAFFAWLEHKYGIASIKSLFTKMQNSPLNWNSPRRTLEQVSGSSIGVVVRNFGEEYWMQQYAPVSSCSLSALSTKRKFSSTAQTVTFSETRPELSSQAYDITATSAFQAAASERDVVIRVNPATKSDVFIYGYQQKQAGTTSPLNPHLIRKIYGTDGQKNFSLGKYGVAHEVLYYRVVVVNGRTTSDTPTITLTMPHLISGPSSGRHNGGYSVTFSADGLGDSTGTVHVGGTGVTPTSWSDTSVTFTMPQVSDSVGSASITIVTPEGAKSNSLQFNFYN